MFCVVETVEDGEKMVTAVPNTWVEDDKTLLWPRTRKDTTIGRKTRVQPQPEWQKLPCRILFENIGKQMFIFISNIHFIFHLLFT